MPWCDSRRQYVHLTFHTHVLIFLLCLPSSDLSTFSHTLQLLYKMQDVFNLVPNLRVEELVKAFAVTTNDQMLVVYMAALVRSVVSLHSLISNKIACRDHEQSRVTQALDETKSTGMRALP